MCRLDGQVLARESFKVLLQQPLGVILSYLLAGHCLTNSPPKTKFPPFNIKQEKPRSNQLKDPQNSNQNQIFSAKDSHRQNKHEKLNSVRKWVKKERGNADTFRERMESVEKKVEE